MSGRFFSLISFVLAMCLLVPLCSATVAPVTSVTTDNPPGSPPYNLLSVTVGNYTVDVSGLTSGTSTTTLDPVNGLELPVIDDMELGTQYSGGEPTDAYTVYMFGGNLWTNANGDEPDFFLFEAGGQDNPTFAAILPGGVIGQGVTIPASDGLWGSLGNGYNSATNGQQLYGVSFAITDLLDADGNPLTNSSIIEGLAVTSRSGLDPSDWFAVASAPILTAMSPDPADGAILPATWASLGWLAGQTAASHEVYVSDSFDDVNDRTAEPSLVDQPSAFLFVGFFGAPFPDGLVPGTTYYWAVDEVEADGTTKHKGSVWSFMVPPTTAYNPDPVDGTMFVDPDVTLGWTAGLDAKLHYVHFGDNFDDVNNAAVGTPAGTTTFTPGTLELDKTYYWRVDESNPPFAPVKGDVWSFTTTLPGLGTAVMDRWENMPSSDLGTLKNSPRFPNNPDVTETVTSFLWNGADIDDYSARIEAWVYVPATGNYTFWLATDDDGELWLSTDDDSSNVELIANIAGWADVNQWTKFASQRSAPIPLVAGERYYIMALWREGGGGDHCHVAWEGPGIPTRTTIPGGNLSPFEPMTAFGAKPANRAVGVTQTPALQWKAGLAAASHELYFGTDADAVANATKASPEYIGARALGAESYEPAMLAWSATYYWRVDEINTANPDSPWVGKVWSFTTADFGIVEDFEPYNDIPSGEPGSNLVYETWLDGYGTTTNGSAMGYTVAFQPTMETGTVHGGQQSAPLEYNNTTAAFSEAARTLASQNWTDNGIQTLLLWFHGDPTNTPGQLYVKINGVQVNYTGASANLARPLWQPWPIDLASVGTNLQSVTSLAIGVQGFAAVGTLLLDDIGLYQSVPAAAEEIYLEAEAGTLGARWRSYIDPASSGGRHIGSENGDGDDNDFVSAPEWHATYSFNAVGGTYKVVLRAQEQSSDGVWVRITTATAQTHEDPDQPGTGWVRFNGIDAPDGWAWDEVHSDDHGQAVVNWTLPAGLNTIEIAKREDGVWFDAILITDDVD